MIFGGKFRQSGREGYAFAVAEGFRGFGPAIYGELMSYGRDPWIFQSSIARNLGCSVRTVQRWLATFRALGLLECWRAKPREIPPGLKHPLWCGFSHRSMTAWHAAGAAFRAAVERIQAKREARILARAGTRNARNRAFVAIVKEMQAAGATPAEIDAELSRRFPSTGPPE
jgi:RNase P protein component